jgi:hypothetical protein
MGAQPSASLSTRSRVASPSGSARRRMSAGRREAADARLQRAGLGVIARDARAQVAEHGDAGQQRLVGRPGDDDVTRAGAIGHHGAQDSKRCAIVSAMIETIAEHLTLERDERVAAQSPSIGPRRATP